MNRFNRTLLAATCCGLVTLPLIAADGLRLSPDKVVIEEGGELFAQLSALEVSVADGNDGAVMTADYVGVVDDYFLATHLDRAGVTFPDGSEQQSAAYSRSETDTLLAPLTPTVAWPMICKTDAASGFLPDVGQYATLFCRSPLPGVPGGTIGSGAGVPSGYFFVITDVLANCTPAWVCAGLSVRVTRRNIDSATGLEEWIFPFPVSSITDGLVSVQATFAGPLMVLELRDYLVGEQHYYGIGSTPLIRAQVMGYLTDDPSTFRP